MKQILFISFSFLLALTLSNCESSQPTTERTKNYVIDTLVNGNDTTLIKEVSNLYWNTGTNTHRYVSVEILGAYPNNNQLEEYTYSKKFDRSIRLFFFDKEVHFTKNKVTSDREVESQLDVIKSASPSATTFTISLDGERRPVIIEQGFAGPSD